LNKIIILFNVGEHKQALLWKTATFIKPRQSNIKRSGFIVALAASGMKFKHFRVTYTFSCDQTIACRSFPESTVSCRFNFMTDYRTEAPQILRDFLSYHETIKGHSQRTVNEYYLDLRNFFRYLKQTRDPSLDELPLDEISIRDVDLAFVKSVTLSDIYGYMTYLSRDRVQHQNSANSEYGLNPASRARKIATIRSFYKYLTNKAHLLDENPVKDIDSPKLKKTLPRYLTLEQSMQLLNAVDGKNKERDYCILTLFLNCGLRISELVGLNLNDIQDEALRVLGKGDKVRIVYLNDACLDALKRYLEVRRPIIGRDQNALFLSAQNERISRSGVHALVKKHLTDAGIDASQYSSHKLRHTAATLMLQNGVDVRAVQEVLGHEHLNTTEIYTHIDNDALRVAARANPLSHVKQTGSSKR
jgi:site-specific recombinase XerD